MVSGAVRARLFAPGRTERCDRLDERGCPGPSWHRDREGEILHGVRIGLISDLHGNLPALEAVLAQLEHESIDRYVCLGDVAVGPWAAETVTRLRELDPEVLVGNWDAWMVDGVRPCGDTAACRKLLEMSSFWADQLDDDDRAYLGRASLQLEVETDTARVLFFHGSPRSYNEPILAGHAAPVVVVGHTHVQMVRRLPLVLILNPGSVGLPVFEFPITAARICPWAEYGILDLGGQNELSVELRRTRYDYESVLQRVLASGVPHAEWWVSCWQPE
jgi:putative phosphoesterase